MMQELNPTQQLAARHGFGPAAVFAGAGSGKTRVITARLGHLVDGMGVAPERILAVTFTNRAAREMRERTAARLGEAARRLWVHTFHATCARILRLQPQRFGLEPGFVIYDEDDQRALVRQLLRDMGSEAQGLSPREAVAWLNRSRHPGGDDLAAADPEPTLGRLARAYHARLRQANAVDFLRLMTRLVEPAQRDAGLADYLASLFDHVLVDEFQDTNRTQGELVGLLTAAHGNLFVVGDDDQSIYRWRGADRRLLLYFEQTFRHAEVFTLEQNYRSTPQVLQAANAVIAHNRERQPKTLWTQQAEGAPVTVLQCNSEQDEARTLVEAIEDLVDGFRASGEGAFEQVAILYRVHAQSRQFEDALRNRAMPYRVYGGLRFYERAEVKDVLAYLRVVHSRTDDAALLRIVNVPARGIGKTSQERLVARAAEQGSGLWEAIKVLACEGSPALRRRLGAFVELIETMASKLAGTSLAAFARLVARQSTYLDLLEADDSPEGEARLRNVQELFQALRDFELEWAEQANALATKRAEGSPQEQSDQGLVGADCSHQLLCAFLEQAALASDGRPEDAARPPVALSTIHAAKGLEFDTVFVAGLEEELFPLAHRGALPDEEGIEEERRLAYVAMTRARYRLVLSYACSRQIYGKLTATRPSRFLLELPDSGVEYVGLDGGRCSAASPMGIRYDSHPRRFDTAQAALSPSSPALPGESYVDTSLGSDFF